MFGDLFGPPRPAAPVVYAPEIPALTFADVVGLDAIKADLSILVPLLRGDAPPIPCRAPRGLLLVGPPGSGKTRLAEAFAGEAQVPFFVTSGAEFIEMFVGVGATRVRDIFQAARAHSPSVVFIDALDQIGRARGGVTAIDAAERESTVNALLAELDGFARSSGVLTIGAVQTLESIDSALRRPGRFDRIVHLGLPDLARRRALLRWRLAGKQRAADVDDALIERLSRACEGASSAAVTGMVDVGVQQALRRATLVIRAADLEDGLAAWRAQRDFDSEATRLLADGSGFVAAGTERPGIEVRLASGEVIEGYLDWVDHTFVKVIAARTGLGTIIRRSAIKALAPRAGQPGLPR